MSRPQLASCEGEAHTGETTLSKANIDGIREMLEAEDVSKQHVLLAIKALKPSLSSQLDRNVVEEAETAVNSGGSRAQTINKAVNLLMIVLDRVFPTGLAGGASLWMLSGGFTRMISK